MGRYFAVEKLSNQLASTESDLRRETSWRRRTSSATVSEPGKTVTESRARFIMEATRRYPSLKTRGIRFCNQKDFADYFVGRSYEKFTSLSLEYSWNLLIRLNSPLLSSSVR